MAQTKLPLESVGDLPVERLQGQASLLPTEKAIYDLIHFVCRINDVVGHFKCKLQPLASGPAISLLSRVRAHPEERWL